MYIELLRILQWFKIYQGIHMYILTKPSFFFSVLWMKAKQRHKMRKLSECERDKSDEWNRNSATLWSSNPSNSRAIDSQRPFLLVTWSSPDLHPGIGGPFHCYRQLAKETGYNQCGSQSFGFRSPQLACWELLLSYCSATQHRHVPWGIIKSGFHYSALW
jgi:hypothetical protein